MMKRLAKWILWIFGILAGLILAFYILLYIYKIPVIIPIKEGKDLVFTNQYDEDALLMIPAAYTNEDGTIQGEYRIDGKIYGKPSRKERISLHPTKGIIISGSWHSDNGFQQTVLVKNGKARMHDDDRKRIRRALCNENKTGCELMIVESATPMTLSDFAKELSKIHAYDLIRLCKGIVQDMLHRSESRYRQLRIWLVWQNEIQQVGILQQGKADKLDLYQIISRKQRD